MVNRPEELQLLDRTGLEVVELSDELRRVGGWPCHSRGVVVTRVAPGSLAASSNLRVGSLLVGLNGSPVGSEAELLAALEERGPRGLDRLRFECWPSPGALGTRPRRGL